MCRVFAVPLLISVAALTGCGNLAPKQPAPAPVPQVVEPAPVVYETYTPPIADASVDPSDYVSHGVDFLAVGDRENARQEFLFALQLKPDYTLATRLLEQMDVDPIQFLGSDHYTYEVQPGDSMYDIAQEHLGRPLRFYILSRYNGIEDPSRVGAGQMLRIPKRSAAVSKSAALPAKSAIVGELLPAPSLVRDIPNLVIGG